MSQSVKSKKNSIPFFQAFFVGLIGVFLGLSLLCASFQAAIGILILSVICTAGMGLLFWLPVCYIVGYVIISLAKITVSTDNTRNDYGSSTEQSLSSDLRLGYQYVVNAKQRGMSKDEIVRALLNNGWTAEQVKKIVT